MKPLTIAIDFDNTWTADPFLWLRFCEDCKAQGHTVIIATGRDKLTDDIARYYLPKMVIVYCGKQLKDAACRQAGYIVDIWIDDSPEAIKPQLIDDLI